MRRHHFVLTLSVALVCCSSQINANTIVNFNDLATNTRYYVGDTFSSNGVNIYLNALSPTYQGGDCAITDRGYAHGVGNEAWVGNVMLHFNLGTIPGLSLLFGNYGGYNIIEINGDTLKIYNFLNLNKMQVGGVNVSVTQSALSGNVNGRLTLSGTINSFAIGGQELAIDDINVVTEPSAVLSLLVLCCLAVVSHRSCRNYLQHYIYRLSNY